MPQAYLIESFSFFVIMLSVVIGYHNWRVNKNVIYLTTFLAIYALSIVTYKLFIYGGSVYLYAILLNNIAPLYFLLGPMLYFFVRGIVTDKIYFRKKDILHFIPFAINLIAVIPYLLTPIDFKLKIAKMTMQQFYVYRDYDFMLFYPHFINNIGRAIQLTIYLIVSFAMLVKFYPQIKPQTGSLYKQFKYVYFWLLIFLILVMIISLNHVYVALIYAFTTNLALAKFVLDKYLKLALAAYLTIPVFILFSPRILYGLPRFKNIIPEAVPAIDAKTSDFQSEQKPKSGPDENSIAFQLADDIMSYLKTDKPYLKPDFSIHDICIRFDKPQHHIYYCFSNVLNKNFIELKKELRVQYALELLSSNAAENVLSMEGIGRQAGFASNSNFYACFKEVTGLTPNQWLQKNRKTDMIS
jgi:AraC-like DNA-binding protein